MLKWLRRRPKAKQLNLSLGECQAIYSSLVGMLVLDDEDLKKLSPRTRMAFESARNKLFAAHYLIKDAQADGDEALNIQVVIDLANKKPPLASAIPLGISGG